MVTLKAKTFFEFLLLACGVKCIHSSKKMKGLAKVAGATDTTISSNSTIFGYTDFTESMATNVTSHQCQRFGADMFEYMPPSFHRMKDIY